jgi:hypothetical protein
MSDNLIRTGIMVKIPEEYQTGHLRCLVGKGAEAELCFTKSVGLTPEEKQKREAKP